MTLVGSPEPTAQPLPLLRPGVLDRPGVEGPGVDRAGTRRWLGDPDAAKKLLIGGLALVALAVQLYAVVRHGYLKGITEYDDAVYLGTASRLVHGVMPYKDFAFVAPPGVPLLMTPVAFLGRLIGVRDALMLARLVTAAVTAANVALLGVLLRNRKPVTVLVACGVLAAYPAAILSGRTLLLEPYLVLFCLLGALLVFAPPQKVGTRGLLLAGLAFGFAGTIKVWAVLPLVAAAMVCWPALRGRIRPLVTGAAFGFVLPCLPFFLAAPRSFVRDVFWVQLERSELARTPLSDRLSFLTGTAGTPVHPSAAELVVVALLVAAGLVALFVVTGKRLDPLERFAAVSSALVVASFLWPDAFYYHYASFLAPFVAILLGAGTGRLAERFRPRGSAALVAGATAAVLLVNVNGAVFAARQTVLPAPDPAVAVDLTIPHGACVVTDTAAYLVNANRFATPPHGCPDVVDPLGATMALTRGHRPSADLPDSAPAVQALLQNLSKADFLILSGQVNDRWPWTPTVTAYIQANFFQVQVPGVIVFERTVNQ